MANLHELAAAVVEARKRKEEIEAELASAASAVREAEAALIAAMRDVGIEAFKDPHLGMQFSKQTRLSVKRTDEDALFSWLRHSDYASVIRETVHYRTLERVVRETLEAEGRLPPGVEASEFDVLSIRKS